jgi:hypothetical protein
MSDLVAIVYMNRGWWVAMCPMPYCDHAEYFGVSDRGEVGGLTPDYMMCPVCTKAWPVKWPAPELREGVEQLLSDRPDVTNRNWLPHETLADLMWENTIHGITPGVNALEAAKERGGGIITAAAGDSFTAGARELEPARRLSIGGRP